MLQRFGLTLQGNETVGKGGQGTRAQRRASPMLLSKIFAGSLLTLNDSAAGPREIHPDAHEKFWP
jgi:hypothetical protein